MTGARLYGPRDLRVDQLPGPAPPGRGEAHLSVTATGICGSDLHTYITGEIGDTRLSGPIVPGHEFAAVVEAAAPDARDGNGAPLRPGMRVAVDPAQPCGSCDLCLQGHPNLCRNLHFCGLSPDDGCLRRQMVVPAGTCFPLPDEISDEEGALLEPLGVALHAVSLAGKQLQGPAVIIGAGPIGLLILQAARIAGASPIYVVEKLPWRLARAAADGAVPVDPAVQDPVRAIDAATGGMGVDLVFEAAWAGEAVQWAADMASPGGRLVLVGIPSDDRFFMKHSTGRRKGLTLLFSRRMKHTYPRAIELVRSGAVSLTGLVTHRFPLERSPEAFELNADYKDNVIKTIITS